MWSKLAQVVLVVIVLVGQWEVAWAQFGPPGGGLRRRPFFRGAVGPTELLRRPQVREELQLTPEQLEQIDQLRSQLRQEMFSMFDLFRQMRSAQDDQQREQIRQQIENFRRQLRQKALQELSKILSPEQMRRLEQLQLREQGVRALAQDEYAQKLGLSREQKDKIAQILQKQQERREQLFRRARQAPPEQRRQQFEQMGQELQRLREQTEQEVFQVLTARQRQKWEELLGPPLEESGRSESGSSSAPTSDPRSSPAPASAPAASSSDSSPGKVILPGQDSQTGPQASFAPQGGAPSDSERSANAGAGQVRYVSFNFRRAPWEQVLRLLAEVTGLTLDLRDVPPGEFSYYDRNRYTPEQAIDVLNGFLLQRGYLLVRRDKFLVVLKIDKGIPPNLIPTVPLSELPKRGRNELLTVILPLGELDPEKTAQEVQGLLGPQGKVVPLSGARALVVTDIGSNLLRIQALLQGATPPVEPQQKVFRAFALRYRPASEAAEILRRLFNLEPSVRNVSAAAETQSRSRFSSRMEFFRRMRFGMPFDPREFRRASQSRPSTPSRSEVSVAVDRWTNSVLVTAPARDMKIVEEAIRTIDVPQEQTTVLGNQSPGSDEPYLQVYQLQHADAREVAKTLGVLHPNNVINEDGRFGRLHIWATAEEHRQIAQHIRMLDGAQSATLAVIPLQGVDPNSALSMIQTLFAADGQDAPAVVVDATGTQLIVRASAEQVAQIRSLLEQYGQATVSVAQRGPVRRYSVSGDPAQLARLLQRLWQASGGNPIQVVLPPEQQSGESGSQGPSSVPAPESPGTRPSSLRRPSTTGVGTSLTVVLASQKGSTPASGQKPQTKKPASDQNASSDKPGPRKENSSTGPKAKPSQQKPPIVITVGQGQLIISSEDQEALDRLEVLLRRLVQMAPSRTRWTVFYLRNSDATEVVSVLEQMLPVNQQQGVGGLRIVPEPRSNALFVTGPAELVRDVEQLLRVLDADELPGNYRNRVPRTIPVRHADVSQVAQIIRDVYRDYMEPPRRSRSFGFFGSSRQEQSNGTNRVRLTLGVDTQTSQLVVSCSDALYREIVALVQELDQAAYEAQRTVRVVALHHADSQTVQQALVSLFPQISISTTAAPGATTPSSRTTSTAQRFPSGFDAERAERIRRFFEFLRARRFGAFGPGRPPGAPGSGSSTDRFRRFGPPTQGRPFGPPSGLRSPGR